MKIQILSDYLSKTPPNPKKPPPEHVNQSCFGTKVCDSNLSHSKFPQKTKMHEDIEISHKLQATKDQEKRLLVTKILEVWLKHPELRFGQFLALLIKSGKKQFIIENSELLQLLTNFKI